MDSNIRKIPLIPIFRQNTGKAFRVFCLLTSNKPAHQNLTARLLHLHPPASSHLYADAG